ncbi:MAG: hypothetical protein IJB59_01750 [Oscillospiraceae bacterium]|nr:hypothetical protein [Oscillospiraceae bacterium]
MGLVKKSFSYFIFGVFLVLGVLFMPSRIGMPFLITALLLTPSQQVKRGLDVFLGQITPRETWITICITSLIFYWPVEEYALAVNNLLGRLQWILQLMS